MNPKYRFLLVTPRGPSQFSDWIMYVREFEGFTKEEARKRFLSKTREMRKANPVLEVRAEDVPDSRW